jgi:hypothetical protein
LRSSSEESTDASTVHIEDDVESKPPTQIKAQELKRVEDDDASSDSSISDNGKPLHNEMMKLCYEIESAIGGKASDNDDSSVDLSFQEEKHLRAIVNEVETHLKMTISLFNFFSSQFSPDRGASHLRDVRENHR